MEYQGSYQGRQDPHGSLDDVSNPNRHGFSGPSPDTLVGGVHHANPQGADAYSALVSGTMPQRLFDGPFVEGGDCEVQPWGFRSQSAKPLTLWKNSFHNYRPTTRDFAFELYRYQVTETA